MQGFGNASAGLQFYIANRPAMDEYSDLSGVVPINQDTIERINAHCGNHWRKIFNVLAKLMFSLGNHTFSRWQDYRDHKLLTETDNLCLLFNSPQTLTASTKKGSVPLRVIAGKTYAEACVGDFSWQWNNERFALIPEQRIIISPYPDYRQLSDRRIETLVHLVAEFD